MAKWISKIKNNLGLLIFLGILFYFFPMFTIILLSIIGILIVFIFTVVSIAINKINKYIIKQNISIKIAYKDRIILGEKYFKYNKISRMIFIRILEDMYKKETETDDENIEKARNILKLPKVFNEKEVKKAWKEKMKLYHPDRARGDLSNIEATKKSIEVNEAKDTLIKYLRDNEVFPPFNF
jgi:hypothetical protein